MIQSQLIAACPHCHARHNVQPSFVGKQARCPKCKQTFQVVLAQKQPTPAANETLGYQDSATDSHQIVRTIASSGPPVGSTFGRFIIRELLGQGAFGRVYQAHDPHLDRFVALKIPTFGSAEDDKVQRFLTEAKAAARLRHPHIVPIYESGQVEGQYYIASQFVDGQTLSKWLAADPPNFRQAAQWTRQLAEALAYAHSEGVIHRDIKPDNIMLDERGAPQIMDFGLAKRLNEDSSRTTDGAILGTPAYMPPEQARGDMALVGPASDQYSLGVVLFEMLTGKKPFEGPPHAVIAQVIKDEPPQARQLRPSVPPQLAAICAKAMAKQPASRYASASDLAEQLEQWLTADPSKSTATALADARSTSRRGPLLLLAGLCAAAIIVIALVLWSTGQPRLATLPGSLQSRPESSPSAPAPTPPADETAANSAANPAAADVINDEARSKAASSLPAGQTPSATQPETTPSDPSVPVPPPPAPPPSPVPLAGQPQTLPAQDAAASAYREAIAKAQKLIRAGNLQLAEETLKAVPLDRHRAWEHRYLSLRATSAPVINFATAPGLLRTLRFAPSGKYLLAGGGGGREGEQPWNAVFASDNRKWTKLPGPSAAPPGGRVCAISHDGATIMSVHNDPARGDATPIVWNADTPTRAPKQWSPVKGYAIDCCQTPGGDWCVLTASLNVSAADRAAELEPPLRVWNVTPQAATSETVFEIPFYAACLSQDGRTANALVLHEGETCWGAYDLPKGTPHLLPVGTPLTSKKQMVKGLYDNLLDWRVTAPTSTVFAAAAMESPGPFIFVNPGQHPKVSGRLEHLAATFDALGERLFVVSGQDAMLRVFDVSSAGGEQPLLTVPLVGVSNPTTGWVGIELSPTTGQLVAALDDTLTFFDVPLNR